MKTLRINRNKLREITSLAYKLELEEKAALLGRIHIARVNEDELIALADDITERKRVEEELLIKSQVLDQIKDRVTVTDLKGTIRYSNLAEKESLGVSNDELIGASIYVYGERLYPGINQPKILEETLRQGSWRGEIIHKTKEGEELIYDLRTQKIFDENGNQIALAGISTDITKRIRQEEELRLQNGLVTSLLNTIPDLVFYKDLEGVHLGGNAAYAKYLGIPLDEIAGKSDYDLHSKEDADFYRFHDIETLEISAPRHNEEWITYPDGGKVLLDTLKTPYIDQNGNIIGILGIGRDVTKRKIDEMKLMEFSKLLEMKNLELERAIQQAESANNAKSRYLAHMNHEIRTPLNGFMGFLQLMETTTLDQMQQEYMQHMKQSTSHMLSIINNVLDMAKIEAGEMKLTIRVFDLQEEIETALAPLRSLAKQKNIQLQLTLDNNMPQQVEGDPDRLRQILLNLGGNAVKFTEEGQVKIAISCPEITDKQNRLQLVVEDTGPGMTQETLDKLFLPFYQADDGITPQSKGSGLGMTITKELVELMDGHIHAESTTGRGSKVEVFLLLNKTRD